MCGICGMISNKSIDESDRLLVQEMSKKLEHRGPDDTGYFEQGKTALAHRRLSILDLSEAGHQPMMYLDRYVIVYNGEIYNYLELRQELREKGYHFQSNTDTEVVMAAFDYWKLECFSHFNGMWAIALYDRKEHDLILSRDRFGVKPLYYCKSDGRLLFASEIKAILCDSQVKRIANDRIVYDYLLQGLLEHTNETFFQDIYKLPAGSYCVVHDDLSIRPVQYHTLSFSQQLTGECNEKLESGFRNRFHDSVACRLRSDVPVGSCLSGGLDSSSIVCCVDEIRKVSDEMTEQFTFSYCAEDKNLNEFEYMEEVIQATDVTPYFVTPNEFDLIRDLDQLIYNQDEPFGSTSIYASYRVYQMAAEHGIKVMLDGQGADEFLCGYRKSRVYYLKRLLKNYRYMKAAREFFHDLSQVKTSLFLKSTVKSDLYKLKKILVKDTKSQMVNSRYLTKSFMEASYKPGFDQAVDFQFNDVYKISLPALLRYADRNSMAFGVESRLPFLDVNLATFCAALPLSVKMKDGYSKYIMRQALKMPEKIRKRKDKIGFATPEDEWMRKGSDYFKSIFENPDFCAKRFINKDAILEDWDEIIFKNKIPYVFRIICLEKWMELFSVK